jgi:TatA/E family protein of Tat protein translocase
MPFDIGTREIVIIIALIIFLFGAKKIPAVAKSIADGIRSTRAIFKKETSVGEGKA